MHEAAKRGNIDFLNECIDNWVVTIAEVAVDLQEPMVIVKRSWTGCLPCKRATEESDLYLYL